MPVNPLIRDKIGRLDVPDKVKAILNEVLDTEDRLEAHDEKRAAVSAITKILEKHADDEDVAEFCAGNG